MSCHGCMNGYACDTTRGTDECPSTAYIILEALLVKRLEYLPKIPIFYIPVTISTTHCLTPHCLPRFTRTFRLHHSARLVAPRTWQGTSLHLHAVACYPTRCDAMRRHICVLNCSLHVRHYIDSDTFPLDAPVRPANVRPPDLAPTHDMH